MKRKFLSILVALAVLATCFVVVPASADEYIPKTDLSFEGLTLPEATVYYVDEDFNDMTDDKSIPNLSSYNLSIETEDETDNKYASTPNYGNFWFSSGKLDCDKLVISVDTHSISDNKNDFVLLNGNGSAFLYLQAWTSASTADIAGAALIPYGTNDEGKWASDSSRRVQVRGCKNIWGRYTFVFERQNDVAHLTQIRSVDKVYTVDVLVNGLEWWNQSLADMKIKSNLKGGTQFDNIVVYGYKADGSVTEPEQPGPEQPDEPEQPSGTITLNQYMPKSARDLVKYDFNVSDKTVAEYTEGNISVDATATIEDGVLKSPTAYKSIYFPNLKKIDSDRLAIHFKVALGNGMAISSSDGNLKSIYLQKLGSKLNFSRYVSTSSTERAGNMSSPELSGSETMHTFDMVLKRVDDSAVIEAVYMDDTLIQWQSQIDNIIGMPFFVKWWEENEKGVLWFTGISGANNVFDDIYIYVPEDINVRTTATSVIFKNTSNDDITGTPIVAYYDENGKLISCTKLDDVAVLGYTYSSDFDSKTAKLPERPDNAKTMKVFYWNSLDKMSAISNSYKVDFN